MSSGTRSIAVGGNIMGAGRNEHSFRERLLHATAEYAKFVLRAMTAAFLCMALYALVKNNGNEFDGLLWVERALAFLFVVMIYGWRVYKKKTRDLSQRIVQLEKALLSRNAASERG